jgi:hypothetical protein
MKATTVLLILQPQRVRDPASETLPDNFYRTIQVSVVFGLFALNSHDLCHAPKVVDHQLRNPWPC